MHELIDTAIFIRRKCKKHVEVHSTHQEIPVGRWLCFGRSCLKQRTRDAPTDDRNDIVGSPLTSVRNWCVGKR